MKFPKAIRINAIIPTASMADIAFLLNIFFMLTTTFSIDRTAVKLPETVYREEVNDKQAAYIIIDKYGALKFSTGTEMSKDISSEDLPQFVNSLVRKYPFKEFVIKADKGVRYVVIEDILETLRQAKVSKIYMLSEHKTDS